MTIPKRILITGAHGLLGRHALKAWSGTHEMHAIVRSELETRLPGVTFYPIDLARPWKSTGLPERVDAVIHLAQSTRMRDFPAAALDIYGVNTHATAVLLDYAYGAGATHFVLASTGGLYAPSPEPLTEDSRLDRPRGPLSYYFDAKRAAESLAAGYAGLMHISILRPFFMYGPGQRETMLIPRLVGNVRLGNPISVVGGTGTRLNPVHALDAVRALEACLAADTSTVLNVAGPEIVTIRDIASHIGTLVGLEPVFEIKEGVPDTMVADIDRLRSIIGAEMTGLRDALSRTLAA